MDDELLVRLYNVGLGDCIYLRVPDPDAANARHVLIDCGNKFSDGDLLRDAVADLEERLPDAGDGRKRLDLLVVTHPHEDHVRGFDVELFAGIRIERMWLSGGMDPEHPDAENARALTALADATLARLTESRDPALAALAGELLALSRADGLEALTEGLPAANGIEPLYVDTDTPEDDLAFFSAAGTRLRVLAPMHDVDAVYLGRTDVQALTALRGFGETVAAAAAQGGGGGGGAPVEPSNVSREDFRRLRDHLADSALAFVLKAGHLINNLSVVLLLEWRGRRLLFTGDAEVKTTREGKYEEGKPNYSWNAMWHHVREHLEKPLDFLKVGHHGSYNATPWTAEDVDGGPHPVNEILDHLLPVRAAGDPDRYAVVSTERTGSYEKIPLPELMAELGRRVSNAVTYDETPVQGFAVPPDVPQPQRTDLEHQHAGGARVPWIDVTFAPAE